MSDDSSAPKRDLKAEWREEAAKQKRQAAIDEARAASPAYDGPDTAEEEAAQSEWQKLAQLARVRFPDHLALRFNLTPTKRVACVASLLGWTLDDIATGSGKAVSTVQRWLREDAAVEFMRAFEYHQGTRDAKEILDKEMFATLRTITDIRDNVVCKPETRLQAAKLLWEMKHGKAVEKQQVAQVDMRTLNETIQNAYQSTKPIDLTSDVEDSN